MNFTFEPLTTWPRPDTRPRKRSPFASSYNQTQDLLKSEMKAVKARNIVIQMALSWGSIRGDNWPYANARPSHPGVILRFDMPYMQDGRPGLMAMVMPCDNYLSWQDNLRAIALSLDALRKVNRYGVTQRGEQYRGFDALPGASEPRTDFSGELDAAVWLNMVVKDEFDEDLSTDSTKRKRAYQIAARLLHPDTPGTGDAAQFRLLQKAKVILGIK